MLSSTGLKSLANVANGSLVVKMAGTLTSQVLAISRRVRALTQPLAFHPRSSTLTTMVSTSASSRTISY